MTETALCISRVSKTHWRLERPLIRDGFLPVPAGFVTDLDSVPRIPVIHTIFKGRAVESSVIHDFYYRTGQTRSYADAVFLRAMQAEGVRRRYRYPIYWAVRLFGRPLHDNAASGAQ
jgi:hypothetical protein